MSKLVECNDCFAEFTLPKLKRSVLKDLVYRFYFNCPDCNHEYVSYYTDKKIRRDINRQKKRWTKYRQMGTEESERKLLAEIKMNDKLIKKDMDNLFNKMESDVIWLIILVRVLIWHF